jgi:mRNA interferase MazF
MARLIKRGQLWVANLDPGYGVEIRKKRPVLIISNDFFNQQLRTVIVIPISTQVLPLGPEKIMIEKNGNGLEENSAVLAVDIRAIDKIRLVKKVGKISKQKLLEVEEVINLVLGMSD